MNYLMNFFEIIALGEVFDVEGFVLSTSLPVDFSWRRGDPKPGDCGVGFYKTSGIGIRLGNGFELPFREQERIAADFLVTHCEALRTLGSSPGVQRFFLRLQQRFEVKPATAGFDISIARNLIRLAAEINLQISIYVDLLNLRWGKGAKEAEGKRSRRGEEG